jgi:TatD DNase family protein
MTDAHCHPSALSEVYPQAEDERRFLKLSIAASASSPEDFAYNETIRDERVALCFAVHPQLAAAVESDLRDMLPYLFDLAASGKLDAVGETGFDLFNDEYKACEAIQDRLFEAHLETALRNDLPLVLHVRKAMHKVFARTKSLKQLPAVVFHSFSGTLEDADSLLRRGVNAYFSIGTPLLLNHKRTIAAAAHLPLERLLSETDAPYQMLRGQAFSHYADLESILTGLASLRGIPRPELENAIDTNWKAVFTRMT